MNLLKLIVILLTASFAHAMDSYSIEDEQFLNDCLSFIEPFPSPVNEAPAHTSIDAQENQPLIFINETPLFEQIFEQKKIKKKTIRCFAAAICDKKFRTQKEAKNHYARMHRKNKQFKCDKCPQSYTTNDSLLQHKNRIHASARHFCPHCYDLGFYYQGDLNQHMNRSHPKKIKLHHNT